MRFSLIPGKDERTIVINQPGRRPPPAANDKAMLHKTKNIELNTRDLDMLTVLLNQELGRIIKVLKTAPLDADTDEIEREADAVFELARRLEAARDEISREIFAASAWVNGIEDTYNQMLDID